MIYIVCVHCEGTTCSPEGIQIELRVVLVGKRVIHREC